MRILKELEKSFEEQKKQIQGEEETEPEATPYEGDDDQEEWEQYEEDEWSKWHHQDEKEESSKESSFVVISEGKRTSIG
jgi:hypothetical protein